MTSQVSSYVGWKIAEWSPYEPTGDYYHVSPTMNRDAILQNGLQGNEPQTDSWWPRELGQPLANYFFSHPDDARDFAYTLDARRQKNAVGLPNSHIFTNYPGDLSPEQWYEFGLFPQNGQWHRQVEPPPEAVEWPKERWDAYYNNQEDLAPIEGNINYRDFPHLPPELHGYDIWKADPRGLPIEGDPEPLMNAQQRGHVKQPLTREQAEAMIHAHDDPFKQGMTQARWFTRHPVGPERLSLHDHLPPWDISLNNHTDRLFNFNEDPSRRIPAPLAWVPQQFTATKLLTCETCGNPLKEGSCPLCDWGEPWGDVRDTWSTDNPRDPTYEVNRGVQPMAL